MNIFNRIAVLFPTLHMTLIAASLYAFILSPGFILILLFLFNLYLFPIISFRIINLIWPIREGTSDIFEKAISPWWISHQIQGLYNTMPFIESLLKLIPGCYSLWLRLWGNKVGKHVYWTPGTQIYDRILLDIGDHVLFGERSIIICHIITPKEGKGLLFVKGIIFGDKSFVGAGSAVGPGCRIEPGVNLKAKSELWPNSIATTAGIQKNPIQSHSNDN